MITLSASTLGAPGESLDQVLEWLQAAAINGIELRLAQGELADICQPRADRRNLRDRIAENGATVTCVASYVSVCSADKDDVVVGALVAALDYAADVGAPLLRVFPGAPTGDGPYDRAPWLLEPREETDARAAERLNAVGRYAADLGVIPALETHDSHPTGADIARILSRVHQPVGAIWDLMHPWRVGESLERTWQELQPWLGAGQGCVQIKDAALPGSRLPLPIGEGSLPTAQFAHLLRRHSYSGTVTLEWERAWHRKAAPLPVAMASARNWLWENWPEHFSAISHT